MSARRLQFGTRELLKLTFLIALMIGCVRLAMAAEDGGNPVLCITLFAAGTVAAFAAAGTLRQRAVFGAAIGLVVLGAIGLIAAIEIGAAMLTR